MALVTNAWVKDNFVQFNSYYIDENGVYQETILTSEIELSENKLNEYVDVDADSLTSSLKLHLLNIIKYRGFVRKHGDTEFDRDPQIVKDYNATIETLENIKSGEGKLEAREIATENTVKVTAKPRRFGNADGSRNWFT